MSIANNYRKLGRKARRAKKYKNDRKDKSYRHHTNGGKYKSNRGNRNCIYCCQFYYIGKGDSKQVLVRENFQSKIVKRWLKDTLSNFVGNSIIGYVIERRFRDGSMEVSYKRTLENWDKYMDSFYREYPNAVLIGYINKDRS